jgi:hypothetical protein
MGLQTGTAGILIRPHEQYRATLRSVQCDKSIILAGVPGGART